ncbi:type II secretion system protein N [Shewanella colwelliana]|uniref:Type II secretion system protein N n=1 Tax=Shewanella colwelliana TaxID=23 RepID=A0A1E5IW87_SHECO|nr:type II secretion system protein N [Shewanella colwelliana]MDX1280721.1 type II secretion system protein N [Shewanella colwelliana]OEG74831.1 type II secretion system protein N [Shewanella colwelliana]GIU19378.1 type II secretion system protein N [Shewanella colwelliana]GIU42413.1 type II secretion system protein N [Shewanella colwelliana]
MSLVKKVLIGVAVYLVFLIALFPASLAVKLAPLPKNIVISGVSGTIWSGNIDALTVQKRQLELIQWQLSPWGLLLGKANLDLVIGNRASVANGKGFVSLSMSGVDASDLRFEAPSDFLIGNARLPFRTKVDGHFSLMVQTLEQGLPWCEQLVGKLFVQGLQVNNQFGQYPLGDMAVGLSCVDGNIKIASDETMNPLGLTGHALLKADKQIQVTAKVRETDAQPNDLKQALSFLGKKDSQGYYPITYQGRLPI